MSNEDENIEIAKRWCQSKGPEWRVVDTAGRGGTAPVFSIATPNGDRAFKLLDREFSEGARGEETEKRIQTQIEKLGEHDCPYLIKIYEGGRFEKRFFLLMNKAPGTELAKCLALVPRQQVAVILDQIAQACIYLRDRGLCHRDIKSANIFVTDDFNHSTLLDLSVMRDIHDPVGIGTDHGGYLPVVATSRYSPPEYLFRLIDPGPDLWHAVDIYQLGGLLHDMIMRTEMFEKEYQFAKENRYRFAWIVATQNPDVSGIDVDPSLLFLAARALDKDWRRRSGLDLQDFRLDRATKRKLGLELVGLAPKTNISAIEPTKSLRSIVSELAAVLEEQIIAYQRSHGITAIHRSRIGSSDAQRYITFEWTLSLDSNALPYDSFSLQYIITALDGADIKLNTTASLVASSVNNKDQRELTSELRLPEIVYSEQAASILYSSSAAAIAELAAKLIEGPVEGID